MKKKQIKMIFSDIDGTLINDDNELSSFTRDTLQSLSNHQIKFGLATGRNYQSASEIALAAGFNPKEIPIIALNGLQVEHPDENYSEKLSYMNFYQAKNLAQIGFEFYMGVLFFFEDIVYYIMDSRSLKDFELGNNGRVLKYFQEDIQAKEIKDIDLLEDVFQNKEFKKLVFIQDPEYSELVKERIAQKFDNKFQLLMVGKGWAEIMPQNVNKGAAIRRYAHSMGIDTDEIMTIGDSDNDLTMIQKMGHGLAVKNARNSVKISADVVSEFTNNEDAVARYILENLINDINKKQ